MNFDNHKPISGKAIFPQKPFTVEERISNSPPLNVPEIQPTYSVVAPENNQERLEEIQSIEDQIHTYQLQEQTTVEETPTANASHHVIKASLAAIPVVCFIALVSSIFVLNRLKSNIQKPETYPVVAPTTLPIATQSPQSDQIVSPAFIQAKRSQYPEAYDIKIDNDLNYTLYYQGNLISIMENKDSTYVLQLENTGTSASSSGKRIDLNLPSITTQPNQWISSPNLKTILAKGPIQVQIRVEYDQMDQWRGWELK